MYVIIDITMESSFDSDVGIFQNSAFVLQLKVLRGGRGGGGAGNGLWSCRYSAFHDRPS